jgi:hypothetical protein
MADRFISPDALREFALETASQLRSAGQPAAADIMHDAATFVTGSGWEWLGELAHAAKKIEKKTRVPDMLAARLARIREVATSGRPYGY